MKRLFVFSLSMLVFIGVACTPFITSRQVEPVREEPQVVIPEPVEVIPTPITSPIPELFFPKATYQDTNNNYEFDYPANWAFDDGEQHSRGYYVQFYSWDWQPGEIIETTPAGETMLSVTVNYWDPKNDLEAFVDQRKLAWDSSGTSILSDERVTLEGERLAAQFTVQSIDGTQSYYLFTTIGEQYLTFSGSGDLGLLSDIAHTMRPIQ
jgi:hypothetical protein